MSLRGFFEGSAGLREGPQDYPMVVTPCLCEDHAVPVQNAKSRIFKSHPQIRFKTQNTDQKTSDLVILFFFSHFRRYFRF